MTKGANIWIIHYGLFVNIKEGGEYLVKEHPHFQFFFQIFFIFKGYGVVKGHDGMKIESEPFIEVGFIFFRGGGVLKFGNKKISYSNSGIGNSIFIIIGIKGVVTFD